MELQPVNTFKSFGGGQKFKDVISVNVDQKRSLNLATIRGSQHPRQKGRIILIPMARVFANASPGLTWLSRICSGSIWGHLAGAAPAIPPPPPPPPPGKS